MALADWKMRVNSGQGLGFILSASVPAFLVYFCMYAFRKPFAVGIFDDVQDFAISYKVVLVLAQLLGYASSKFIGIKVISELTAAHRPWMIIALVLFAELALLGFALVPPPYNFVLLFFNGLPLGMIWGLVFSYLEGRRTTELLAAILSASFILASGVTKAIGKLDAVLNRCLVPCATVFFCLVVESSGIANGRGYSCSSCQGTHDIGRPTSPLVWYLAWVTGDCCHVFLSDGFPGLPR